MVLVVLGEKLLGVREVQAGPGHQVDQALRGELVVKFLVERVVLADLVHREGREHLGGREDKPLGAPAALGVREHREHHLDLEAAHLAGLVDLEDLARPAEEHQEEDRLDRVEERRADHLVLVHQVDLADREEKHLEDHLAQAEERPADQEAEHPEAHLDLVEERPEEAQVVREKVQLALVVAHPAAARLALELLADREEHLVEHREKDHLDQAVLHLGEVRLDRVEEHPADHLVLEHPADLEAERPGVHLVPGVEHLAEHPEEDQVAPEEERLADRLALKHLAEEHPEVQLALEPADQEHPEDLAEKPLEVPAEPAESASLAERDRIPQLILELAHLPALALAQEQVHMVL